MKKRTKCVLLYNYFRELIDRKRHAKKYSTADLYCATTNWIKKFTGTQLPLDKVTPGLIDRFHAFLLSQKNLKNNSIISYLHNFRAMYNTAIREHLIRTPYISPFAHLSLRKEKTAKRAVSPEVFENICQLNLPEGSGLSLTADLCVFSYLACGISFIDLANLNKQNIIGDEIVYNRKKTGTQIRIRITKGMCALIDKYQTDDTPYLFPILDKEKTTHGAYKSCLLHYNANLQELSALLRLPVRLTSYVIRHSWATGAFKLHIPVAVISQALGHTSEKTTRYYLDQLDQSELDQANAKITHSIERILKKKGA